MQRVGHGFDEGPVYALQATEGQSGVPWFDQPQPVTVGCSLEAFFEGKKLLFRVLVQVEVHYSLDEGFHVLFSDKDILSSRDQGKLLSSYFYDK